MARQRTTTSEFGVGKRESHDASAFYERFDTPPPAAVAASIAQDVLPASAFESAMFCGDSRKMSEVPDGSVALVVTSPPYFAGKQYEIEFERDGVPASYTEYLTMLTEVFGQCADKLEPGGRIAVNVANLGRKPYRSLSADVIGILQDELGLLLRGEIIWQKGEGANGSCAWGTFRSAANPVLRDVSERVIVASKGQFSRALTVEQRRAKGLPHVNDVLSDDFLAGTLDVWEIPPESARRVNHPAPFPVELPERLIRLLTFRDDLVLDPFLGSGSTAIAALRTGRRYAGYDMDPTYVEIARGRIEAERERITIADADADATDASESADAFPARAADDGKVAQKLAYDLLVEAGFDEASIETNRRVRGTAVTIALQATDATGHTWYFDVSGAYSAYRGGLTRTDTVWKTLGRAYALRGQIGPQAAGTHDATTIPLVLLTSPLPNRSSEGDTALRAAGPDAFYDAVDMLSADGLDRLRRYATEGPSIGPLQGFWTAKDGALP